MTYAGIGSRQTPPEILSQMTDIAKELESKGYILRTGDAKGADKSFREGTGNSEIYRADDATDVTRAIAKEIHPNPDALTDYALDLMARNTNQVFGENLDTPVDFVLYWAKESNNPMRPQGGTGQAVEMANLKGIPTINMAVEGWREKLDSIIGERRLVNIYAGTNENIELSNFAIRPFVAKEPEQDGDDIQFQSVEQAFQYFKTFFANEKSPEERDIVYKIREDILKTTDGKILRSLGRNIPSLDSKEWDSESEGYMEALIFASFTQNPEALKILLETGNAILTHTQDNTKWKKLFPEILMRVRERLQTIPQQLELFEDTTLNQLKDAINEKFKDQDNFKPLTLKDVINMTPEQISNLKNCL